MRAFVTQATAKLKEWGPDQGFIVLAVVLAAFLAIQGVRYGFTGFWAASLAESIKRSADPLPKRDGVDDLERYNVIPEKGVLGKGGPKGPPPVQLFGIIGKVALLGASPGDAQPYEVGATVPGDEKLIEIRTTEVVLEKEEKKRTLSVFPDGRPTPSSEPTAPPPPPEEQPEEGPPPEMPTQAEPAYEAPPAPVASVWVITAETLVGTKWSFQGMTVSFDSGSTFSVDAGGGETIEGTWRIDGNTLTVSIMGEETAAEIQGDKIYVDGNELSRVE
jgi:hypothetical protein